MNLKLGLLLPILLWGYTVKEIPPSPESTCVDKAGILCCSIHGVPLEAASGFVYDPNTIVEPWAYRGWEYWRLFPNSKWMDVTSEKDRTQPAHYHFCPVCEKSLQEALTGEKHHLALKIQEIIFPEIRFNKVELRDALDFIEEQMLRKKPELKSLQIKIRIEAKHYDTNKTIDLMEGDISAYDLLWKIVDIYKLHLEIEGNVISLTDKAQF